MAKQSLPEHVEATEVATLRSRIEQLHSIKTMVSSDYHDPSLEEMVVFCLDANKLAHEIIELSDEILNGVREAQDVNLRIG